jgi:hypothetical protein
MRQMPRGGSGRLADAVDDSLMWQRLRCVPAAEAADTSGAPNADVAADPYQGSQMQQMKDHVISRAVPNAAMYFDRLLASGSEYVGAWRAFLHVTVLG